MGIILRESRLTRMKWSVSRLISVLITFWSLMMRKTMMGRLEASVRDGNISWTVCTRIDTKECRIMSNLSEISSRKEKTLLYLKPWGRFQPLEKASTRHMLKKRSMCAKSKKKCVTRIKSEVITVCLRNRSSMQRWVWSWRIWTRSSVMRTVSWSIWKSWPSR